jgi:hypothetical protein
MPPARITGPISGFGVDFYRGDTAQWGAVHNRTTGSTYNRQTGNFYLFTPVILRALLWDVYAAATYKIAFVDSSSATPNDVHVFNDAIALAGTSVNTIPVSPGIILMPGRYYLSIYCSTKKNFYDQTSPSYDTSDLYIYSSWYDGTGFGSYSLPVQLVGNKIGMSNIANYQTAMF